MRLDHLSQQPWSHSEYRTTVAVAISLGAIRLLIPLSEKEYSDNCQDQYIVVARTQ